MSLESFLRDIGDLPSDGRDLSFSLNQAGALKKLSTSQLPRPELWIVKMVQAANRGEAESVDIQLGRRRVQVSFDSPRLSDALSLFNQFRSGELPEDPFLRHLLTGLRGAMVESEDSFLLQVTGPNGADAVVVAEGETQHFEIANSCLETPQLTFVTLRSPRSLRISKAWDQSVSHLVKGTASEHAALLAHCWPSQVPITLDGRRLDTRYDSSLLLCSIMSRTKMRQIQSQVMARCCNLYLRYLPAELGEPTLRCDDYQCPQRKEVTLADGATVLLERPAYFEGRFLQWPYPHGRAGAVLIAPRTLLSTSHMFFLHDGAVVASLPFHLAPGAKKLMGFLELSPRAPVVGVCIPIDFPDLDLSQFALREPERRRQEWLKRILPHVKECERVLAENLGQLMVVSSDRSRAKVALGSAGIGAGALGLSLGVYAVAPYLLAQGFLAAWPSIVVSKALASSNEQIYETWLKTLETLDISELEQPALD